MSFDQSIRWIFLFSLWHIQILLYVNQKRAMSLFILQYSSFQLWCVRNNKKHINSLIKCIDFCSIHIYFFIHVTPFLVPMKIELTVLIELDEWILNTLCWVIYFILHQCMTKRHLKSNTIPKRVEQKFSI